MSSREELFRKAKEEQDKLNQEKANGSKGHFDRDYDEIVYLGLQYGKPSLVRLLGNPKLMRDGDPYSPKEVNLSWIVGDNGKPFRCVWPLKEENPSWILWKIFDKVMSYKWDSSLNGGKGGPVYHNADKYPALFKRVAKNNKDDVREQGWKPAKHIIWNCIDRLDMQYHLESKKTKLLSRKADFNEEGKQLFPSPGVPSKLYLNIWDEVVKYYGDWETYDIQIVKEKTGDKDSDVSYRVICGKEKNKIDPKLLSFVSDSALTDEENSFEKINIDKVFQVSSYQKILKNLGIFIQSVDATFNTKFYQELQDLAETEKKTWEEINNNNNEKSNKEPAKKPTSVADMKSSIPTEQPAQDPSPATSRRSASTNNNNKTDFSKFKGYVGLTEEEKKCITGVKPDGTLSYVDESELIPCGDENCNFESPSTFTSCPNCGIKFAQ